MQAVAAQAREAALAAAAAQQSRSPSQSGGGGVEGHGRGSIGNGTFSRATSSKVGARGRWRSRHMRCTVLGALKGGFRVLGLDHREPLRRFHRARGTLEGEGMKGGTRKTECNSQSRGVKEAGALLYTDDGR